MAVTIQLRKGLASQWAANSSIVLASGEPGFEIDTGRLKIGNGTTQWGSLQYASVIPSGFIAGSGIGINLGTNGSTANISVSGSFVANSGAFNQIVFNTGLADPSLLAGQLQWNSTEGTLDLGLNDNYAMHLGEELLYRVRNVTGSTLLAGSPVYASGLSPGANNRIEVNLYAADGNIREIRFMGLITEDLPNNGTNGYATQFGYIRGIDTRGNAAVNGTTNKLWTTGEPAWNQGDILYVHPSVPGKLTKIEPKHSISVAIITTAASNGKIFVRPTSYGHLNDNHDVNVSGVTNGQFLQYNSATDYWVPSPYTYLRNEDGTNKLFVSNSGTAYSSVEIGGNSTYGARGQLIIRDDDQDVARIGTFNGVDIADFNTNIRMNNVIVSVSGHTHTSSDITNFNSAVSGLIPSTIVHTTGNQTIGGVKTFNDQVNVDNLRLDGNTLSSTNSNGNIIIQPSGNGALQRDSGGNARGEYAVDWQTVRSNVDMVAGGPYSVIGGGRYNTSSGNSSTVPGGFRGKSTRYGELSHAAGRFGNDGDAQHTILVARRSTTDATANQALFLDGSSARLTLPAETTWAFTIKLSAYNDTDNQGGWWIFRGGIRRNADNGTALIGSLITESGTESSLSTASASVVADDTNEALEIRVTGVASKNIRWVAVVDISQVSWGTP